MTNYMYMYTVSFILFRSLFFPRLPLSSFTAVGTPVAVLSSRLAANAVGRPSFSGWSTCRRNCSGCADSQNLIFSQPAHAVRRRRTWWSIRSSSRRRRLVREGKHDGVVHWASRTSTPAIPTSNTSRTSLAEAVVRLKQCPPARQLSWRTPS